MFILACSMAIKILKLRAGDFRIYSFIYSIRWFGIRHVGRHDIFIIASILRLDQILAIGTSATFSSKHIFIFIAQWLHRERYTWDEATWTQTGDYFNSITLDASGNTRTSNAWRPSAGDVFTDDTVCAYKARNQTWVLRGAATNKNVNICSDETMTMGVLILIRVACTRNTGRACAVLWGKKLIETIGKDSRRRTAHSSIQFSTFSAATQFVIIIRCDRNAPQMETENRIIIMENLFAQKSRQLIINVQRHGHRDSGPNRSSTSNDE